MSNSYTFQILDSNNLVSAAIEASIAVDAQYVIDLVSRYIGWNGTMDFAIEIRSGYELTWSNADGLLPSIVQTSWNGSGWACECGAGSGSNTSGCACAASGSNGSY